ncbi:MAG: type VI secretion system tip protein VgrG [Chitinispirillaceae bacterium]|nr:type VI secretion system tip protein VgrG [Chitinispirillaceae bacterium]
MPKDRKANESQFFFVCGDLKPETFMVMHFQGMDGIDELYEFSISVQTAKSDLKPDEVINKPASFFMFRDNTYHPYSGIVKKLHFLGTKHGQWLYEAVLVPKLSVLELQFQTRVFQKKTVPDIIKEVLDLAGLQNYYTVDLSQTYAQQEFVVQYQESDFNFISRLMESAGIWYFFKEPSVASSQIKSGGTIEKLVITDKPASFAAIQGNTKLPFKSAEGMAEMDNTAIKDSVFDMQFQQEIVPREVILKNYNYRTPEVQLMGKNKVKGGTVGSVYEYGGRFKNIAEAQNAAQVEANRIGSRQTLMSGASNCRAMRAGARFTLAEHSHKDLNIDYLINRIVYTGGHKGEIANYTNRFQAIPSDKANNYAPLKKTPVPKINGIMTATIEANGSEYALLDDMGRYKVRMPFDNSSSKNAEASKYLRLAQPYAGAKYGIHFPSHEGTEMVWACIDGNPDKPMGIAMAPNANTISPVVSANKTQNTIRTAGGNEMVMDDTDKKQKIRITTTAKHTLLMDDENKNISLKSTKGNELILDDKNECVKWNGSAHSITMTYKGGGEGIVLTTKGGNTISIDDANKKIIIQSNAGHTIEMDDNGKKIVLGDGNGKNKVTLDGSGGLILNSQGKIEIKAQQDLVISAANIKMTANGALEAKAAMDLKLKGMNLEAKGDMNAKVEGGMNAEVKGGVAAKLDGTMTDVSGGAMTKIKGGIVMIN